MRGYISFLLVLCILVCIFAFLEPFPAINEVSDSKAIEAERTNAVSMNVKETLILSTSYWLRASAMAYDLVPESKWNKIERNVAIKAGILSGWALLEPAQFDPDFEVVFWCSKINSRTKDGLSAQMIKDGMVLVPKAANAFPVDCAGLIDLHQKPDYTSEEKDQVHLRSSQVFEVVGASIYSKKYGTANVVYVPSTEVMQ